MQCTNCIKRGLDTCSGTPRCNECKGKVKGVTECKKSCGKLSSCRKQLQSRINLTVFTEMPLDSMTHATTATMMDPDDLPAIVPEFTAILARLDTAAAIAYRQATTTGHSDAIFAMYHRLHTINCTYYKPFFERCKTLESCNLTRLESSVHSEDINKYLLTGAPGAIPRMSTVHHGAPGPAAASHTTRPVGLVFFINFQNLRVTANLQTQDHPPVLQQKRARIDDSP